MKTLVPTYPPISQDEAATLAEMITYALGQIAYRRQDLTPGQIATDYLQKTLDRNLIEEADPEANCPNLDDGPAMAKNLEVILCSQRATTALNKYADAATACAAKEYDLRDLAESSIISALLMAA